MSRGNRFFNGVYRAALITLCAGLLFAGCAAVPVAQREVGEITILQLNDVYEIFPVETREGGKVSRRGGMPQVATVVNQYRGRGDVLLLHAGDIISPSLLSGKLRHKGAQMIAALNGLNLDAATFGNHEFDFGCKAIVDRLRESNFQWVAANVVLPPDLDLPDGRVSPYLVLQRAGLRVGIFGLALPIQPISGCGPVPITFTDPVAAARDSVAALEKEGVDLVVGLTHLRMEQDQALARAVPGIDLIVGGHEHEVLEALVGRTLITKAGANAFGLGAIRIRAVTGGEDPVVDKAWDWVPVNADEVAPDPTVAAALAGYKEEMKPFAAKVGSATLPLDALEETVREGESNLGNLIADIVRESVGADLALINGGSVRDDRIVPPGPITLGDIFTMLPFSNEIVAVEISGARLIEALENGVSLSGQMAGRFPQVSGMSFTFDPAQPVGQRIVEVRAGDRKVDPLAQYTLATTDFLVERGEIDGYTMLHLPVLRKGGDLNDAIVRHFREHSPVCAAVEGRIVRAGGAGDGPGQCRN